MGETAGQLPRVIEQNSDPGRTIEQCNTRLRRVIRRRLSGQLRRLVDSTDIEQAVWGSVLRKGSDLPDFSSVADLTAFMARMAANKITDEYRRSFTLQKRLQQMKPTEAVDLSTPSNRAVANETLDRLTRKQPVHVRRIVELRMANVDVDEISRRLMIHRRKVFRILRRLYEQGVEGGNCSPFAESVPDASSIECISGAIGVQNSVRDCLVSQGVGE